MSLLFRGTVIGCSLQRVQGTAKTTPWTRTPTLVEFSPAGLMQAGLEKPEVWACPR